MNIFVLDLDPVKAAQYHANKHTIKMILETAQLISTAVRLSGIDYGYKITHRNHPCAVWARATQSNFEWLRELGIALCEEYTYRWSKYHKSFPVIYEAPKCIVAGGLTPFAQAMPSKYKTDDVVKSYRAYYREGKSHLLTYTKRQPPEWLNGIASCKDI